MTAKRLLLILALLGLLAASGVVWAAATATTHTVVQELDEFVDPGTTWTEGGITHLRGFVADTVCYWDYDGDGITDEETIVEVTINSDRDAATGAGHRWGTWSEYDAVHDTVLLGGGTFQGKDTCWEGQGGPEYVYGSANVLGWRLGPDGDWGQIKLRLIGYSLPDPPYLQNRGEGRFLVPGDE
jgi:hypothetical protein